MITHSSLRAPAIILGTFLALGLLLAAAGGATAAMNAPAWSSGDYWRWAWTSGSTTTTQTWTVLERTSLTFPGGTYGVWHVNETTTTASSSGSTTVWQSWWIQGSNLGRAQQASVLLGVTTTMTWDPPQARAVFPLAGNTWSLTTTQTLTIGTLRLPSVNVDYSGQALAETDVTVPAGTFHVTPVRSPASGSSYEVRYYADGVGNFVRIDTIQNGATTRWQNLTSYSYQSAAIALFAVVLGGLVGVAIIAAVVVYVMRRRPRYPARYAQMQPIPAGPPPYEPPPRPPSGGPPGT